MIYNFAFIITDGTRFVDERGKLTKDVKRAHRFPYHGEAKAAAAAHPGFRVREVE
jgi:hypothetical protein